MVSRVEELLAEARWLEGLARALVGEREAARDLVQDVWVRTLEDPPRDVRRPRAWLGRVLRNALSSRRRSESARASRERAHERDGARGADDVVERAEAQRLLVEAVLALDEPLRRTVLLHFFDGLSSAEIARRQGVPDSTVRTRLAQALQFLRERLGRSRADWQTGLGLIACGKRELERGAPWTPSAKAGAWVAAAVIGGLWMWSVVFTPERASAPLVSRVIEPAVIFEATRVPSATGERQTGVPTEASTRLEAPLAKELLRLRIVALVLAEGSEQPIRHAEVLFACQVVATGDKQGRIDSELVVREDAPREFLRRIAEGRKDFEPTSEFFVCAPGWTRSRVWIPDRLAGTLQLGVSFLRPASEVTGIVLDEQGVPVRDARVTWRSGDWSPAPGEAPWGWTIDPEWQNQTPETKTDSAGRFRLSGVPLVSGFVAGWTPAHAYAYGSVFRMSAGETRDFTLVLPRYPGFVAHFDGVVLDPDGAPLNGARVTVAQGFGFQCETDDEGRFSGTFVDPEPEQLPLPVLISVFDPAYRYLPVELECPDVTTVRDLHLMLGRGEELTIEVRSAAGGILEGARVTAAYPDMELVHQGAERRTDAAGRTTLPLPPQGLQVSVEAVGHVRWTGPVPSDWATDEPFVIVLEPRPVVRGSVLFEGRPVAGAIVHGGRNQEVSFRSQHVFQLENAFDLRFPVRRDSRDSVTDEEGRFVQSDIRFTGSTMYAFWVEAEGLPTTSFGPIPAPCREEIEIAIEPGGVLEGRVLVPVESRACGYVVGVSNGFGFALTVPVEADGTFRFQNLAPGDYQIRAAPGPAAEWVLFRGLDFKPFTRPISFDCRVESGRTTRFDVDLRGEGTCLWRARVDLPLPEERSLTTQLYRLEPGGGSILVGQRELDAEGRVEFSLSTPGPHRLEVALYPSFSAWTKLTHTFELLPGESSTFLELRPARLRFVPGARVAAGEGAHSNLVRFVGRDEAGWRTESVLALHQVKEELLLPVPSGKLMVETADAWKWSAELSWTAAGELTLAPGETLEPFAPR